ncbi:MAG: GSCFA domain-containing protein [Bacteroidota bacterium]
MELMTPISIKTPDFQLDYGSNLFCIGSCFAENLAHKFDYYGFRNLQNPLGILFHPFAIENAFKLIEGKKIDEDLFVEHEGIWKSFEAHSKLNRSSKNELIQALKNAISNAQSFLATTNVIFITLGSAWVYRHLKTNKHVANCHKIPAAAFQKELPTVSEIESSIANIIQLIRTQTSTQIYFSISPVRHKKDGLVENNRSKGVLLAALHQVLENSKNCTYFPAYELVLDELRDYRFYNRDLVHPNSLAIDFVWDKFAAVFLDKSTYHLLKKVNNYRKFSAHRPTTTDVEKLQQYKDQLVQQKGALLALEPRLQL